MAVKLNPAYVEAYSNLGVTYYFQKRFKEAADTLKQTIRLAPDFAEAHFYLGAVYIARREKSAALKQYARLQSLNSDIANKLYGEIFKDKILAFTHGPAAHKN